VTGSYRFLIFWSGNIEAIISFWSGRETEHEGGADGETQDSVD